MNTNSTEIEVKPADESAPIDPTAHILAEHADDIVRGQMYTTDALWCQYENAQAALAEWLEATGAPECVNNLLDDAIVVYGAYQLVVNGQQLVDFDAILIGETMPKVPGRINEVAAVTAAIKQQANGFKHQTPRDLKLIKIGRSYTADYLEDLHERLSSFLKERINSFGLNKELWELVEDMGILFSACSDVRNDVLDDVVALDLADIVPYVEKQLKLWATRAKKERAVSVKLSPASPLAAD